MLRYERSVQAKNGKLLEAVKIAKDYVEHINAKYPSVSFQVYVERFGDYGTIYTHADYKDLASLEDINAQILADQEHWAHLKRAADLVIEGSTREKLLSSVLVSLNHGLPPCRWWR